MPKTCFTTEQLKTFDQLLKLMEECGEVVQISLKYIEHGPDSASPFDPERTSNKILLSRELGDILAVLEHLRDSGLIDEREMQEQRENKFWKLHAMWKK